jgi:hypothetical protein
MSANVPAMVTPVFSNHSATDSSGWITCVVAAVLCHRMCASVHKFYHLDVSSIPTPELATQIPPDSAKCPHGSKVAPSWEPLL